MPRSSLALHSRYGDKSAASSTLSPPPPILDAMRLRDDEHAPFEGLASQLSISIERVIDDLARGINPPLFDDDGRITRLDLSDLWPLVESEEVVALDCAPLSALSELTIFHSNIGLDASQCSALERVSLPGCSLPSLSLPASVATLDVSGSDLDHLPDDLPALRTLHCMSTRIQELDVSSLELTQLKCGWRPHAQPIEREAGPALMSLHLGQQPKLTWLDAQTWNRTVGARLRQLDLSGAGALTHLNIAHQGIEALTTAAMPHLSALTCEHNPLRELDLSHNKALESLRASGCPLRWLDMRETRAAWIECGSSELESIQLPSCAETIFITESCMDELDLSDCPKLEQLVLERCTELRTLDVTACPKLKAMSIKRCKGLETIVCTDEQRRSLPPAAKKQLGL